MSKITASSAAKTCHKPDEMNRIHFKPDILKWYVYKILLIMRLTTVILIATLLQVSASGFGQKVTHVQKESTILQLFEAVKAQTGFKILWNEEYLTVSDRINANFKNVPLEDVMKKVVEGRGVTFVIKDKSVLITREKPSFRDKVISFLATIDVTGRVLDENNAPLVGAVVKVKGGTVSTATNSKGEFLLKNVDEKAILVISFIGYKQQEIKAVEKIGDIALNPSEDKLQEVEINAGYYKVTDRERTGSISRVDAKIIAQQPVNNVLMALVGRVPGVEVTQAVGVAGGAMTVKIRGRNSINSDNNPLYVVNGAVYPSTGVGIGEASSIQQGSYNPLSLINPNDIESIEVLKDADATAIYGSRGANGVILISTKQGKTGDTKINAAISQGINRVAHRVDMMTTIEYLQMRKEALKNDGIELLATDYDVNGLWGDSRYTDWQKEIIGGIAPTSNASLNLSGGTANNSYIIGGNYYNEGSVYLGDFGYKRIGVNSAINLGSNNGRLKSSFQFNYDRSESNFPSADLTPYIQLAPNQPSMFDQYGQLNWENNTINNNPMALALRTSKTNFETLIGNFSLSYRIANNLMLKTTLGYNRIISKGVLKVPLSSYNPGSSNYGSALRNTTFGNNYNNSLIAEPNISYSSTLGKGKIEGLIGMSLQGKSLDVNAINAKDFVSDDLMDNPGNAVTLTNSSIAKTQYRYLAGFARLNYSLKDKFFFNLTARRDGSSRFGSNRQYANFGAIGGAWIFSEERFIAKNFSFLSFGKIRASYGVTGNDGIRDYGYLVLWNAATAYQNTPALVPRHAAANADFAWERTRKLEVALQLGVLKNRINFQLSYYRNSSDNQLINQSLPLSTGLDLGVLRNLPAKVQNTGLEIEMNIDIFKGSNFKWDTGLNFTVPKNKLISYPNLENSAFSSIYSIGEPLDILKTYNVTVDKQSGLYTFEDYNQNGSRDDGDRYIPVFLGQRAYGGISNSITYKMFSLDFHFSFVKQKGKNYQAFSNNSPGRFSAAIFSNQLSDLINNHWQEPGDNFSVQKFSTLSTSRTLASAALNSGNILIEDTSYIRLRNIALNYRLPANVISALKIANASISLQAQNVFTFTKYKGLDPETQGFNTPPLQSIMVGLNVSF